MGFRENEKEVLKEAEMVGVRRDEKRRREGIF